MRFNPLANNYRLLLSRLYYISAQLAFEFFPFLIQTSKLLKQEMGGQHVWNLCMEFMYGI